MIENRFAPLAVVIAAALFLAGAVAIPTVAQAKPSKLGICHIPPGNTAKARVIRISARALPAHLAHGDFVGPSCTPTSTPVPPTATFTPVPATNTFTPVPHTATDTPVGPTNTPAP